MLNWFSKLTSPCVIPDHLFFYLLVVMLFFSHTIDLELGRGEDLWASIVAVELNGTEGAALSIPAKKCILEGILYLNWKLV